MIHTESLFDSPHIYPTRENTIFGGPFHLCGIFDSRCLVVTPHSQQPQILFLGPAGKMLYIRIDFISKSRWVGMTKYNTI